MGWKTKFKPHKEKAKRKRGKKYKYDASKDQEKSKSVNPFEQYSNKKFFKSNTNNYKELVNDYKTKNSANSFKDNRIGENSKHLTQDEKMNLRFKAQQMLRKSKKGKFLINEDEGDDTENMVLTHKGKAIGDHDPIDNDFGNDENDEYYNKMNDYIEEVENNQKMTKKERWNQIINHSKMWKEEKQKLKEDTTNKIEFLDENFAELAGMLQKRKRTFNKFNDDYDKYASNFIYADKTHPTERIKTEEEIEMEKENKIKKMNMQRLKEEAEEDELEWKNGKKGGMMVLLKMIIM